MHKLFSILFAVVLAAAAPLNLGDFQDKADIFAKSSDSITATELAIEINGETTNITEFPYSFESLKEGSYKLSSGGNTYTLHIDNTAPTITASLNSGTYKEANLSFTVNGADTIEGTVTNDGRDTALTFSDGKAALNLTENGSYKVEINAQDKAGNKSTKTFNYTIHKKAPEIKFTGLDKEVSNTNYSIKVTVTSEIDIKSVSATLDGKAQDISGTFTVSDEGQHTLKVVAEDVAGNQTTETRTFTIDKTAPDVNITGIEDGDIKNADVSYSVTGSGEITVTLNGKAAAKEGTISEDGTYTLVANSTDEAGNTTSKTVTFTIDKTAPDITITGVKDGDLKNAEVSYSVSGSDKVTVTLNGKEAANTGVVSEDGTYTLVATSTDAAGNTSTKTVNFTIDRTPPEITITGIENGDLKNTEVSYSVSGTDEITVTLNGKNVAKEGVVSEDGTYTLVANSTDAAGNTSSKTVSFTIDKTPPEIEISGIDKLITNKTVNYTVSADGLVTVEISGQQVQNNTVKPFNDIKNGNQTVSGSLSDNGEYTLTANAVDAAGNVAEQKIVTFTIDKKNPEVKIEGMEDHAFYNTSELPFKISGTDVSALTGSSEILVPEVKVDGKNSEASEGTLNLAEGVHTITAKVTDNAGNTATETYTFEVDLTKPKMSLDDVKCVNDLRKVSGNGTDKNLTSVTLTAKCNDISSTVDNSKYTVTGSSGPLQLKNDYNGESKNDLWTFTITAKDKAGNTNTLTRNVIRDTVAPVISLDKVERYVNENVTINASSSDPNPGKTRLFVEKDGNESEKDLKTTLTSEGDYVVTVKAVDAAGNASDKSIKFTIDKTPPVASLDAPSGHHKSVSSVSAKTNEPGTVYMTVTCDGKTVFDGKDDKNISCSKLNRDGEYSVTTYAVDLAGNKSKTETQKFVIDSTAPVVSLSGIKDGAFANKAVTITAEVNERFFETNDVSFTYNGTKIPFKSSSAKSKVSKTLTKDGVYEIKLSAKDKAGNASATKTLKFTLDTKKPEITINCPDHGTYDTVVAPKVTIKDEYFKSKDISITKNVGYKDSFGKTGGTRSYVNIPKLKENDGIYTLSVKAEDEAGNVSTATKTFTINRFGSTFKLKSKPSEYAKEADSDIVITETNVSGIESYNIKVTRDAESFEAENVKVDTNGTTTTYTVPKSNFEKDGVYKVVITTKDKSGNTSKSKGDFNFVIDNAEPVITYRGIEPDTTYQQSSVKMYVDATDTLTEKPDIKVTTGIKSLEIKEDDEGRYVDIPFGYNQNIKITAKDKAGNSASTTVENVSVSTSKLAPILSHKKLAGGVFAGLIAAGIGLFALLRRKKDDSTDGDDDIVM